MFERTSTAEGTDIQQLQDLSDHLESATPQEIVGWAIETYRDKLTVATAFGAEGCCLLAMIAQSRDETGLAPDIFNWSLANFEYDPN
jgi:3'-phosphoadenosine 5'-phosphosulfate sulfotransferase (PAPS reductase)/FAD synthetase